MNVQPSAPPGAPSSAVRSRAWLPPAALWVFFFAVARATAHAAYALPDIVAIAALYGLATWSLDGVFRLGDSAGRAGRAAGILFVGLVLAWHLREQTRPAGVGDTLWGAAGMARFLGTALLLAVVYFVAVRWAKRRQLGRRSAATRLATSVAVLLVALAAAFFASNTLRWHLLQQNLLLGTPAYHLFATPANRLEGEAWARHTGGAPIGQPDWVLDLVDAAPDASIDAPTGGDRRPDIVLIMLDTLRADMLEAWGGDPALMPVLNAYADDSWAFTDVLANSSWTRPSLGSFLTGLLPEEHGATGLSFALSPSVTMLAEILSAQGYETAAFNANGRMVTARAGFDRGFDVFEPLRDPPGYARADFVTDRVNGWLTERKERGGPQKPLFLYVHYLDPHTPYLSSPGTDFRENPTSHEVARSRYEDEVRFLDGELATLFAILDEDSNDDRLTLVASDHGEEFGEHGARGHAQTLYSEVLDIPVIARLRSAAPAARGPVTAALEGRDFFDLMVRFATGEPLDVPRWARARSRDVRVATVAFEKQAGPSQFVQNLLRPYRKTVYARMIQRGSQRFIWSAYGATDELYDLAADPAERHNIARYETDLVEALRRQLDGIPPYWVGLQPFNVSPEALEELRALGYIR